MFYKTKIAILLTIFAAVAGLQAQNVSINQDNSFLHIKHKKTRLNKENDRQEITGLVVNEKVNVRRRYVKQLRHWIYFWEKYGYEKAEELITNAYIDDKGYVKGENFNIEKIIFGKLEYLKMVKGATNSTYRKLKLRYDFLTGNAVPFDPGHLLNIWANDGIEKAMTYYYGCKAETNKKSGEEFDPSNNATVTLDD